METAYSGFGVNTMPADTLALLSKAVPGKFTGLSGIVNATVYKTDQNFTGQGHGKLS